jgi:hypothetical protein
VIRITTDRKRPSLPPARASRNRAASGRVGAAELLR